MKFRSRTKLLNKQKTLGLMNICIISALVSTFVKKPQIVMNQKKSEKKLLKVITYT